MERKEQTEMIDVFLVILLGKSRDYSWWFQKKNVNLQQKRNDYGYTKNVAIWR